MRKPEVRLHFKVSLKDRAILAQLAGFFGSSVGTRVHDDGHITYYWSSTSFVGALLVYNYFYTHSVQGSSWLNFLKWCKALVIVKQGGHLTTAGLEQIAALKAGMNTKLKLNTGPEAFKNKGVDTTSVYGYNEGCN